jgi:biotin-(acetyl-CoA carboxylase) ligase
LGIDDDLSLLVKQDDGTIKALSTGEVTLHKDN